MPRPLCARPPPLCRRKTGHGGYGPGPGVLRGARVIELTLGAPAEAGSTWIRQEDGSKVVQGPSDWGAKQAKVQRCCLPAPRVSDLADVLRPKFMGPLAAAGALRGERRAPRHEALPGLTPASQVPAGLLAAGLAAAWRRRRRTAGMQPLPTAEAMAGGSSSDARGGFIVGAPRRVNAARLDLL